MKIAIIGAGALGSYFGSLLTEKGEEVILVDIRKEHIKLVNEKGIIIVGPDNKETQYRPKLTESSNIPDLGEQDCVMIAVKCQATEPAIKSALPLIGKDTLVASFQNGIGNLDVICEAVDDPSRILAGTIAHNFMFIGDNKMRYFPGAGGIDLGPVEGEITDKIKEFAEILKKTKVSVTTRARALDVIWNKLVWNAVLNSPAAITRMNVGEMGVCNDLHPVLKDIAAEYFAVAKALGVDLWNRENFVDMLLPAIAASAKFMKGAKPKPSMLQDIELKRKTEIEYINGAIVKEGERLGIPTPVNKSIVALVRGVETKVMAKLEA